MRRESSLESAVSAAEDPRLPMPLLRVSAVCLAVAVLLTVVSVGLGRLVHYYHYLLFFNLLALSILTANVAALALSSWGFWRTRGKSGSLLLVSLLSMILLAEILALG